MCIRKAVVGLTWQGERARDRARATGKTADEGSPAHATSTEAHYINYQINATRKWNIKFT